MKFDINKNLSQLQLVELYQYNKNVINYIDFDNLPTGYKIYLIGHNKDFLNRLDLNQLELAHDDLCDLILTAPNIISSLKFDKTSFKGVVFKKVFNLLKLPDHILHTKNSIGVSLIDSLATNISDFSSGECLRLLENNINLLKYCDKNLSINAWIDISKTQYNYLIKCYGVNNLQNNVIASLTETHSDILALCSEEKLKSFDSEAIKISINHDINNKYLFNLNKLSARDVLVLAIKYPELIYESTGLKLDVFIKSIDPMRGSDKIIFLKFMGKNYSLLHRIDLNYFIDLYSYHLVKWDIDNILLSNDDITESDIECILRNRKASYEIDKLYFFD